MSQTSDSRSSRQQRTFSRLLAATRELAETGGYNAVTMNAMAERAGVSRMTAYQYFRNTDHALAELIVVWGRELADQLEEQAPESEADADPVAIMQARFGWVITRLDRHPGLLAAVIRAANCPDPEVVAVTQRLYAVIEDYAGPALSHLPAEHRPSLIRLLGYLFQSVLSALTTGKVSLQLAREDMSLGVKLMTGNYR